MRLVRERKSESDFKHLDVFLPRGPYQFFFLKCTNRIVMFDNITLCWYNNNNTTLPLALRNSYDNRCTNRYFFGLQRMRVCEAIPIHNILIGFVRSDQNLYNVYVEQIYCYVLLMRRRMCACAMCNARCFIYYS